MSAATAVDNNNVFIFLLPPVLEIETN
jgi:hypothetical protein